jgi:type III secretion system low calcium response chaperone LcrH/SycD
MGKLDEVFKNVDAKVVEAVDELMKEVPEPEATPYKSSAVLKEETRLELVDLLSGKDIRERMERGFEVIHRELAAHETPVVMERVKEEWSRCADLLGKTPTTPIPEGEIPPSFQEQCSISDETIECFYQCGIRAYEHKNYQEASDVFYVLSSIDYRRHNVWMALGLVEKQLGNPESALSAFIMASVTNMEEPIAFMHAAECYITLGEREEAEKSIQSASDLIQGKSDERSKEIADRLLSMKKSMS